MGTRNVIQVIDREGIVKVSQYGQWDGYPSGQGARVLMYATHFLKQIEWGLSNCRFIEGDELESVFASFTNAEGMMTMEQSADMKQLFPTLLRDACADILGYVAFSTANNPVLLRREHQTALGGWLEGVYILDFSTNKFISKYDDRVVTFPLDAVPEITDYLDSWGSQDESGASFDPLGNADYPHIRPLKDDELESDDEFEQALQSHPITQLLSGNVASDSTSDTDDDAESSEPESDPNEKFKCPSCDGYIPNNDNIGAYAGAISRKDNKTEICSACGVIEAVNDWMNNGQ
jgi:hypothetical protein